MNRLVDYLIKPQQQKYNATSNYSDNPNLRILIKSHNRDNIQTRSSFTYKLDRGSISTMSSFHSFGTSNNHTLTHVRHRDYGSLDDHSKNTLAFPCTTSENQRVAFRRTLPEEWRFKTHMNHEPLPPTHISLHDSVHALEETELQDSSEQHRRRTTLTSEHRPVAEPLGKSAADRTLKSFKPPPLYIDLTDLRENDCRNPSNPKSRPISVNPPHTARQNSRQPSSPPVSDSRSFFDLQSTKHLTAGYGHRQESKIKKKNRERDERDL
ncbi:hypothetical protein YC2023_040504 [Brassica napus]